MHNNDLIPDFHIDLRTNEIKTNVDEHKQSLLKNGNFEMK